MNKISVTKIMHTETGHRLTDYPDGRCQHVHGHSYKWEVTVSAPELDSRGMVVDFSDLKQVMKEVIDPLDHAFVMHSQDPLVLKHGCAGVKKLLTSTAGNMPRLFITTFNPTAENMLNDIAKNLVCGLEEFGITLEHIKLWETVNSFAEWNNTGDSQYEGTI